MKKILMIALMAAAAGTARAEGPALAGLEAAAGGMSRVSAIKEPAAAPAGKGFFQNWGNGGAGNGFFKPWDKAAGGNGGFFMDIEACSVVDGVYPSDMTGQEAQAMLGGCFAGISARYGVPVTFAAEGGEMNILVGRSEKDPLGGNAAVLRRLKRELAARGGRLFDFQVTVSAAK